MPCPFCRTEHDSTACPIPSIPNSAEQYDASGIGTINGLTFGEHEICRRLDKLIKVLEGIRYRRHGGGPL